MAELEIDYHMHPVFTASPDQPLFLDRAFLSRGSDAAISRAPESPCLRHRAGSWWIDNDSGRNAAQLLVWSSLIGRIEVPRQCSFALPDGEAELYPWDGERYKVALLVTGTDMSQTRPGPQATADGHFDETKIGIEGADERVERLLTSRHRIRQILAALYGEYMSRGYAAPRTLTREDARLCMGLSSRAPIDSAIQEAQLAIWGALGHGDGLARFLIHRGHLTPAHYAEVPHAACGHRDPRSLRLAR